MPASETTAVLHEVAEEMRLLDVLEACPEDPKALINEIRYFDPTSESWVEFRMFPPEGWEPIDLDHGPAADWYWQAQIIDWWQDPDLKRYMILKARQLGITLLACARALWLMLFRPGSVSVAFSYEEGEAKKLVEATWMMFTELPAVLREHVQVITPHRTDLPSEWIRLRHPDGRISSFQALPATKKHGHGGRVTWAIMDEVARQEYADSVFTAINPAISRGRAAKLVLISTANGVSNIETGEGNFFHRLYVSKEERGLAFQFLPWNLEPTRDEEWYRENAMVLSEVERNQQYPLNEADAFMLSGALYFDREALEWYRGNSIKAKFTGQFVRNGSRKALFTHAQNAPISIFERPIPGASYAMGVDTATGRGSDYTVATVLDLASGAPVALFRAKMESPEAAYQLHMLGKMYNAAIIGVERQGGYGEALIIALRDGVKDLPPYPKLHRHRRLTSGRRQLSDEYGIPMAANRPHLISYFATLLRERFFPWVPLVTMGELGTFVYAATNPSPRAQEGCNDDCVMSFTIATELYRQHGVSPDPRPRTRRKKGGYKPPPTRQLA